LEDIYPKVNSFAALGATGWDGFHYKTAGYRQLGTELAKMTSFHFYGENKKYASPNIRRAYYSSPTRDEITLAFQDDQKLSIRMIQRLIILSSIKQEHLV
jgi:DNA topoisomerase VI subunit A